LRYLRDK